MFNEIVLMYLFIYC